MSLPPPISVLLPVRDAAPYLGDALDSLAAQSFPDFEVIAVDDGSSDESLELLRERAREDGRIRVVRQAPLGLVAALERGRELAGGSYLARMDGDDITPPERLERQLTLLAEREDLVACACPVEYFPPDRVRQGSLRYQCWLNTLTTPEAIERELFVECPVAHPTLLMRASAVDRVGGYRDLGWPEDYDLVLRLWIAGGRLGMVSGIVHRWRDRPDRLSRTHPAYSRDAFRRCKSHYLSHTLLVGKAGVVIWGGGPTGKAFARVLKAHGVELRAFVDLDPRKVGQNIHGAPVVPPEEVSRFRDALCLAAVSGAEAREEIRAQLRALGWTEMVDFVAVA
jgi:glycosyltransferase involved in cell wall biosynthesis